MHYIQGKNREQSTLFPQSLDEIIAADNEVRIIDIFAESLSAGQAGINLADYKFVTKTSLEGRPAYDPKNLLKLLVYGYLEFNALIKNVGKRMQAQHRAHVADEATHARP